MGKFLDEQDAFRHVCIYISYIYIYQYVNILQTEKNMHKVYLLHHLTPCMLYSILDVVYYVLSALYYLLQCLFSARLAISNLSADIDIIHRTKLLWSYNKHKTLKKLKI